MRNQTDAKYLNGPIFSDFGPKSDFVGQKGLKRILFCTQKSKFEQNGIRLHLKSIILRNFWLCQWFMLGFDRKMAQAREEPVTGQN